MSLLFCSTLLQRAGWNADVTAVASVAITDPKNTGHNLGMAEQ